MPTIDPSFRYVWLMGKKRVGTQTLKSRNKAFRRTRNSVTTGWKRPQPQHPRLVRKREHERDERTLLMNHADMMNHTDGWMGGRRDVGLDGGRHLVVVLLTGHYLQVVQETVVRSGSGYDVNCLASRAI